MQRLVCPANHKRRGTQAAKNDLPRLVFAFPYMVSPLKIPGSDIGCVGGYLVSVPGWMSCGTAAAYTAGAPCQPVGMRKPRRD